MEQVERRDGILYYGEHRCKNIEEAYQRFRDDYHQSIGRAAYKRLNRLGSRTERVHGSGIVFSVPRTNPFGDTHEMVPIYLLGLLSGAYCKVLGGWLIPDGTDEQIEQWIDWAFSSGSRALRLVGKSLKTGRTSKRLNRRFR